MCCGWVFNSTTWFGLALLPIDDVNVPHAEDDIDGQDDQDVIKYGYIHMTVTGDQNDIKDEDGNPVSYKCPAFSS